MASTATLALARFVFGFSLALLSAAIFLVLATLALSAVRRAVHGIDEERHQDIASGVVVFIAVVLALVACYGVGHALHAWLGASVLVGGLPNWLAGQSHVSAAALMGATVALGLAAAAPGLWRRWRDREPAAPKAREGKGSASQPAKASKAKASAKAPAKASAKTRKAEKPQRGSRIPALGWGALFLLLLGGVLLAFAYIVAPLHSLPTGEDARAVARAGLQAMHADRARPVYYAGAGLLGAGALVLLAWLCTRRRVTD